MKSLVTNPDSVKPAFPVAGNEVRTLSPTAEDSPRACYSYRFERASDEDALVRRCSQDGAERNVAAIEILERVEPVAFLICNLLLESVEEAKQACENACVEAVAGLFRGTDPDASSFRVRFFKTLRRHCDGCERMKCPDRNRRHSEYRSLLVNMSERQRWVIVLRFIASLTPSEIAALMGIASHEVKAHLWAAMQSILATNFSGRSLS